jgi:hypothetical protein
MNETQWEYVKIRLIVLGCVAGFILTILGICYEWFIVELLFGLAALALLGACIAYIVAEIVYKWRVMGITEAHEKNLFDWYWSPVILDDKMLTVIREIELGDRGDEWEEEYRQAVVAYLLKVADVKRPKLLK